MIVETVKIGNATICVDDDAYINRTKEEMQAIINEVFKIELQVLMRQEMERKLKSQ